MDVQVTYDPRFYPGAPPPRLDDPRLTYVGALSLLFPIGRGARRPDAGPLPLRKSPTSFNVRSLTRSLGSFAAAVSMQRLRVAAGALSGHCSPSVSVTGDVVAGESNLCATVGTVDSTDCDLTRAVLAMGACNRCGLETNLGPRERAAIGLPPPPPKEPRP